MTDADAFVSQPEGLAAIDGPAPAFEIALDITKRGLVWAPIAIIACAAIWGTAGATSAAYALAIVILNFLLSAGGGPNFPGSNGRSCSVWLSHTVRPYLPRRDARQGRIVDRARPSRIGLDRHAPRPAFLGIALRIRFYGLPGAETPPVLTTKEKEHDVRSELSRH